MIDGRIYAYCPEKFLTCLSAGDGKPLWKNSDTDLLEAIGPNGQAQHYITGYATQTYMKAGPKHLFFAGPQRAKLVVASTEDGRLLWTKDRGNLQIVLRDDGFYAAGAQDTDSGFKFSYDGRGPRQLRPAPRLHTGHRLPRQRLLPCQRRHRTARNRHQLRSPHRTHATTMPGRRDHLRWTSFLGTLDVRLPALGLRPCGPRSGRQF